MAILRPPAKTAGEISPTASMLSKADIKPIIWPKNPQTKTNKLIELTNVMVFCLTSFFIKLLIIRAIITIKEIVLGK